MIKPPAAHSDPAPPLAIAIAAGGILAPAILNVAPVRLSLIGMGFGPAGWIAVSWQLASVITWIVVATGLLTRLAARAAQNRRTGRPPLSWPVDGRVLLVMLLIVVVVHTLAIAIASDVLALGRGRPAFGALLLDVLLLYAPMNLMTFLCLVAAALVAAEHRGRTTEVDRREQVERELATIQSTLQQALDTLNGHEEAVRPERATPLERIAVTLGNRSIMVAVDEIDWIEAHGYYAKLHVGTHDYLVRQSMNALEVNLDQDQFARIHRSTIVNINRVSELRPLNRRSYIVTLRDGRQLTMSRRRRRLLDFLLP